MSLQWNIDVRERVTSTQDDLKSEAAFGEGRVIQAVLQDCGRGRHGRIWESQPGNLYLSLLLEPECDARLIGQLSLAIGLAVWRAAREVVVGTDELMLKWPNDVLLGGRKCAGILLETALETEGAVEKLYVGVGVNVASAPPDIGAALQDYSDEAIDVMEFRDVFLEHVRWLYSCWQGGGAAEIFEAWLEAAHPAGAALSVKVGTNLVRGEFHSIDDFGNLILSIEGNKFTTITAGDVYLSGEG